MHQIQIRLEIPDLTLLPRLRNWIWGKGKKREREGEGRGIGKERGRKGIDGGGEESEREGGEGLEEKDNLLHEAVGVDAPDCTCTNS